MCQFSIRLPELRYHSKPLELSQPFDRQHTRVVQLELLTLFMSAFLPVDRLVRDGRHFAAPEVHEMPRLSVSPRTVAEDLPGYYDQSVLGSDLEDVGGQPPATLPELHRDADRALAAP